MVDTSSYKPKEGNDYIKATIVEQSPTKKFVVLPGSGWTEFTNDDNEKVDKPWINVEMDGKKYQWTLSPTANAAIGDEIGYDTDSWVGMLGKFIIATAGSQKYVSATVIEPPASFKAALEVREE